MCNYNVKKEMSNLITPSKYNILNSLTEEDRELIFNSMKNRIYINDERDKYRYIGNYRYILNSVKEYHEFGGGSVIEYSILNDAEIFSLTFKKWQLCTRNNVEFHIYGLHGDGKDKTRDKFKEIKYKMWMYIKKNFGNVQIHRMYVNKDNIKNILGSNREVMVSSVINGGLDTDLVYLLTLKEKFPNSKNTFEYYVYERMLHLMQKDIDEFIKERRKVISNTKRKFSMPIHQNCNMHSVWCKFPKDFNI